MVATAVSYDEGPIAFRYPRGEGQGVELPETGAVLEIGKGRVVSHGERVALVSLGTRLGEVMTAAEALASHGIMPTVVDARFVKPLDTSLILNLIANHEAMITIEEGSIGGFGSHVAQFVSEHGVFDAGFKFRSMILPDRYLDHGRPADMYAKAGRNAAAIEAKVLALLGLS